jgi:hypothetical protein
MKHGYRTLGAIQLAVLNKRLAEAREAVTGIARPRARAQWWRRSYDPYVNAESIGRKQS